MGEYGESDRLDLWMVKVFEGGLVRMRDLCHLPSEPTSMEIE
jgi:hypothetical protein